MALGRDQLPDQVNPPTEGRSVAKTGMEPVSPEARRDYQGDREKAIREMIADYEKLGKDTSHLKKQLGKKPAQASGAGDLAVSDGPAVLEPGASGPSQVFSPAPNTVPEPQDGSAPDKRDQDQSPVPVPGFAEPPAGDPYGGAVPVTAADPGPEAPDKDDESAAKKAPAKAAPAKKTASGRAGSR